MAGAGYKLFNTGDVLTAAQVNTYLQEQAVMVFASATARTTALSGVLAEGMMSYLQDTNAVEVYDGSAWVSVGSTGDITGVTAGTGISGGGTSGTVTITNSMATAIDAKGDLIVGTGADTFARLAVGTNGYTLVADSAETTGLKWQAAASGGGMTSIASGTLSGASVTISAISGSYTDLRLIIKNFKPATDNAYLKAQLNGTTSSSYYTGVAMDTNRSNQTFNSDFLYIAPFNDNSVANGLSQTTFYEYANTSTWKMCEGISIGNHNTTTTNFNAFYQNGFFNSTSAITSITLFPDSGNFTSGDYILYGIK